MGSHASWLVKLGQAVHWDSVCARFVRWAGVASHRWVGCDCVWLSAGGGVVEGVAGRLGVVCGEGVGGLEVALVNIEHLCRLCGFS